MIFIKLAFLTSALFVSLQCMHRDFLDVWTVQQLKEDIIAGKIPVNACDQHGESMVMVFAEEGDSDMIRYLAERGADINYKLSNGLTALMIALWFQKFDAVATLVELGADLSAQDDKGRDALVISMEIRTPNIERWLLQKGATYSAAIALARTALHKGLFR